MRKILGFLAALLFAAPAWATCSAVPFIFSPGTTALSGQVNADLAALVACINSLNGSQITTGTIQNARLDLTTLLTALSGLPHKANNSALAATSSTAYTTVIRDGFATPGDGGAATYTSSNVACTLNAGAGDDGSQVQSADGKCWIADLTYPLDARMWGKSSATTSFYATPSGADVTGYCLETNATCSPQHALDRAQTFNNSRGISVVNIAAGTFTSGLLCSGPTPGSANGLGASNNIWISGAGAASTILADASVAPAAIIANDYCVLTLQNFKITSANGSALFPQNSSAIKVAGGMNFGATALGQFHAERGAVIEIADSYTISGGAPAHMECVLGGRIMYDETGIVITLTGTPAFSSAFADMSDTGCLVYVNNAFVSFSGSATGSRYKVARGATIRTENGSATFLPGNALGTLIDDGNYMPPTGPTLGAPTGLGTGGSPGVVAVSGVSDQSFSVQLTTGSSGGTPASTGTVPLTFGSKLGLNGVACTASVSSASGAWGNGANVPLSGQSTAGATLNWANLNNGALAALATSSAYFINTLCRGY